MSKNDPEEQTIDDTGLKPAEPNPAPKPQEPKAEDQGKTKTTTAAAPDERKSKESLRKARQATGIILATLGAILFFGCRQSPSPAEVESEIASLKIQYGANWDDWPEHEKRRIAEMLE